MIDKSSTNRLIFNRTSRHPRYVYSTEVIEYFDCITMESCFHYKWTCPICKHVQSHTVKASQVSTFGHPQYLECTNPFCHLVEEEQEEGKENKMNLLEFVAKQARIKAMDLPTKALFGELMHDDSLSEEEKQDIAYKVMLAGGYECLEDGEF